MKTGLLELAPSVNTPERVTGEALLHRSPIASDPSSSPERSWTIRHATDGYDTWVTRLRAWSGTKRVEVRVLFGACAKAPLRRGFRRLGVRAPARGAGFRDTTLVGVGQRESPLGRHRRPGLAGELARLRARRGNDRGPVARRCPGDGYLFLRHEAGRALAHRRQAVGLDVHDTSGISHARRRVPST